MAPRRSGRRPPGVSLYVGAPRTGKTTLALTHIKASGRPALLVDSTWTLLDTGPVDEKGNIIPWRVERARGLEDVWRILYGERKTVVFTPSGKGEFEALATAISRVGKVALLVDELRFWANSWSAPEALELGMRIHAHIGVDFYITTQAPQDLKASLRNCVTQVFAFRNTDPNALSVLGQWFPDTGVFTHLTNKSFEISRI